MIIDKKFFIKISFMYKTKSGKMVIFIFLYKDILTYFQSVKILKVSFDQTIKTIYVINLILNDRNELMSCKNVKVSSYFS